VDASVDELVTPKHFFPPTLFFGQSLVTLESIKEFKAAGFFPCDDGRGPGDEIHVPKADEILVFKDFFTAGLRFPCDNLLTVYFGTPNMFITLWFGFDYGTNPPLGTLII
jgi:hypothetical protein